MLFLLFYHKFLNLSMNTFTFSVFFSIIDKKDKNSRVAVHNFIHNDMPADKEDKYESRSSCYR